MSSDVLIRNNGPSRRVVVSLWRETSDGHIEVRKESIQHLEPRQDVELHLVDGDFIRVRGQ